MDRPVTLALSLLTLLSTSSALAKGPKDAPKNEPAFNTTKAGELLDQPAGKNTVGQAKANKSYKFLKQGGPGGNWCKVEVDGTEGWLPCSTGNIGSAGASEPAPKTEPKADPKPEPKGDPKPNAATPGGDADQKAPFVYYVLSLSWSPSFCADNAAKAPEQCGPQRHYAFVVHGLWPQNDKGFPADCPGDSKPDNKLVQSMLDIMPSSKLIGHEWSKHGTCSGLAPADYFAKARAAFESIKIPAALQKPSAAVKSDLLGIQKMFKDANPGLTNDQFSVQCKNGEVDEIRFCVDKQLHLRDCGNDVRDYCKGQVEFPPVR